MKRRNEIHIGRRQRHQHAHEVARRRKRAEIDYAMGKTAGALRAPSARSIAKRKAHLRMLEAIAAERVKALK